MQHDSGKPAAVVVHDVRFGYQEEDVVCVDTLSVASGEVTAIIGPNGCGKTTLFKLMNGILSPDTGEITLFGRSVASAEGAHSLRSRSVYVHQKSYIFRERVTENVAYGLKVRKVPRSQWERRIAFGLEAVGIAHLAHRNGRALSGGERQRLAIARALALEPDLLLLDEPTSNIDPESVRIIEDAIVAARDRGITVLLSTHNLATAYRIADSIVRMEAGRTGPDRNNVYHGTYEATDESLGAFRVDGCTIATPAVDGAFTAAVVPMDDVILSSAAIESSAQNQFRGVVTRVEGFSEGVRVRLDCGFPLDALVTERAVEELRIVPGVALSASFKASAVRLF